MNNEPNENIDTKDVGTCLWHLSGVLMNDNLNPEDTLCVIEAIDKLSTMLARWHHIR